jgi:hypothetical protein
VRVPTAPTEGTVWYMTVHEDVACACDYSCSAQSTCGKWAAGLLLFTLILPSSQTCGEALDIDTLSTTSDEVEQTRVLIIVAGWTVWAMATRQMAKSAKACARLEQLSLPASSSTFSFFGSGMCWATSPT